jgi:hypothetical protein
MSMKVKAKFGRQSLGNVSEAGYSWVGGVEYITVITNSNKHITIDKEQTLSILLEPPLHYRATCVSKKLIHDRDNADMYDVRYLFVVIRNE